MRNLSNFYMQVLFLISILIRRLIDILLHLIISINVTVTSIIGGFWCISLLLINILHGGRFCDYISGIMIGLSELMPCCHNVVITCPGSISQMTHTSSSLTHKISHTNPHSAPFIIHPKKKMVGLWLDSAQMASSCQQYWDPPDVS